MKRSPIVIVSIAVLGVGFLTACGGGDDSSGVHIDSIEPNSATFGDEIVIRGRGFDKQRNQIGFGLRGAIPSSSVAALNDTQAIVAFAEQPIPSEDGKTLRFVLPNIFGSCVPRFNKGGICAGVGLEVPVGTTFVAVFNRSGVSNAVEFRRSETPQELAEAEVAASPEWKALAKELDRWIAEDFVPATSSEFAAASYEFTIGVPEDGKLYIELQLRNIDPAAVQFPAEIEGYEVRVSETHVIVGS